MNMIVVKKKIKIKNNHIKNINYKNKDNEYNY